MSKRTGMTDSQIVDEVLYTGLDLDAGVGYSWVSYLRRTWPHTFYIKLLVEYQPEG